MVGIRKTHPDEPIILLRQRIKKGNRTVSNPISMLVLAWDRVIGHLWTTGIASPLMVHGNRAIFDKEQWKEALRLVGVVFTQPFAIMPTGDWRVHRQFQVLEPPVRPSGALQCHGIFRER